MAHKMKVSGACDVDPKASRLKVGNKVYGLVELVVKDEPHLSGTESSGIKSVGSFTMREMITLGGNEADSAGQRFDKMRAERDGETEPML